MGLVTNEQNNYKCYITGKHLHHRPPPHGSSFLCYENTLLRWLASPTFSKNMKSCKATLKVMNYFIQQHTTYFKINYVLLDWGLTMRKQAPISTAFIFTSKSSGNWMPKLSVSVKTSFKRPLHCLLMRPMGVPPSFPFSCKKKNNTSVHHKLLILSHTLSLNNGNNISLAAV